MRSSTPADARSFFAESFHNYAGICDRLISVIQVIYRRQYFWGARLMCCWCCFRINFSKRKFSIYFRILNKKKKGKVWVEDGDWAAEWCRYFSAIHSCIARYNVHWLLQSSVSGGERNKCAVFNIVSVMLAFVWCKRVFIFHSTLIRNLSQMMGIYSVKIDIIIVEQTSNRERAQRRA